MSWGAVIAVAALWLGLRAREPTRATRIAFLGVVALVLGYAYMGLGSTT